MIPTFTLLDHQRLVLQAFGTGFEEPHLPRTIEETGIAAARTR